ncbi:hypothetical protein FSP39_018630 [Pinctada imbricata]|uniref:Snake toxin/toxin-like domain-containing protein n=1 Tax=Pinctada imbricata TaxID=66713 RepID=A0AA88Y0T1_PINIB|nr:hypothetical protein FSP39_018630 [Pinctada imbricata]
MVVNSYEKVQCMMGEMCDKIEVPEEDEAPLECVDPMIVGNKDKCELSTAVSCLDNVFSLVANLFATSKSVCPSYSKALTCFYENLGGCRPATLSLVTTTLSRVMSMVAPYKCPTVVKSPCVEVDLCEAEAAMECVRTMDNMLIATYEDEELCHSREEAWNCVTERTEHCSENKRREVFAYMQRVQAKVDLVCEQNFDSCVFEFKTYARKVLKAVVVTETSKESSKPASKENSQASNENPGTGSQQTASNENPGTGSQQTASNENPGTGSQQTASNENPGTGSQQTASNENPGSDEDSGSIEDVVQVTAVDVAGYCAKAEEAWMCLSGQFESSGLPNGLITVLRSSLMEVLYMVRQKCDGHKCYSCKNADSNENCNKGYEFCPANKQGCQTVYENGYYKKGCVEPSKCKPGTSKGGKKVTHCCNSYLCNEPGEDVYDGMY